MQKWGEEYDHLRQQRQTKDRVAEASVPSSISTVVADGLGAGSGWNIRDTEMVFCSKLATRRR